MHTLTCYLEIREHRSWSINDNRRHRSLATLRQAKIAGCPVLYAVVRSQDIPEGRVACFGGREAYFGPAGTGVRRYFGIDLIVDGDFDVARWSGAYHLERDISQIIVCGKGYRLEPGSVPLERAKNH